MLTILTGLSSAFSYAVSDLLSQHVTRKTRALTQVVWVLATGVVIIVPVALLVDGLPSGGAARIARRLRQLYYTHSRTDKRSK